MQRSRSEVVLVVEGLGQLGVGAQLLPGRLVEDGGGGVLEQLGQVHLLAVSLTQAGTEVGG